jgi:hypothetical protein
MHLPLRYGVQFCFVRNKLLLLILVGGTTLDLSIERLPGHLQTEGRRQNPLWTKTDIILLSTWKHHPTIL